MNVSLSRRIAAPLSSTVAFLVLFAATTLVYASHANSGSRNVQLKVLIVAYGDGAADPGLTLMTDLLDELRTPYDVFDASLRELTSADLADDGSGKYNGIILTDSTAGWHFSKAEWDILHGYASAFKVRQSVVSGWPIRWADGGMDYGLEPQGNVTYEAPAEARWLGPAGGSEHFEYVSTVSPLPITDFAYVARPGEYGPVVTPLLAVDGDPNQALISLLRYSDGREVMISTIANAWYLKHSQVLAYEFLNFATKGVFLGARKVYLSAHVDDLFLASHMWNSDLNVTPMEGEPGQSAYRMTGHDTVNARRAQSQLRSRYKTASQFVLDFAFNGKGADLNTASRVLAGKSTSGSKYDSLTAEIVKNRSAFRFLNHTYTHRHMNRGLTSYSEAKAEITENRKVWDALELPDRSANDSVLVAGKHSGLKDENGTELDQSDDIPYPDGRNDEFLRAAQSLSVRFLASDSSQLNQDVEAYVPGYDIMLLPRWPTALFYNVSTPEQWTDEYNYIFHERWWEQGFDPATVPGAVAEPKTYDGVLDHEADWNFRHMLTYRPWPFFFHVANLRDYDSQGSTLLFDWLDAVFAEYESYMDLPVQTLRYHEIGVMTQRRLAWDQACVTATLDLTTNKVTFRSDRTVYVDMTGLASGSLYGGQRQSTRRLEAGTALVLSVDRALTE